jgi:hypothetical protein
MLSKPRAPSIPRPLIAINGAATDQTPPDLDSALADPEQRRILRVANPEHIPLILISHWLTTAQNHSGEGNLINLDPERRQHDWRAHGTSLPWRDSESAQATPSIDQTSKRPSFVRISEITSAKCNNWGRVWTDPRRTA